MGCRNQRRYGSTAARLNDRQLRRSWLHPDGDFNELGSGSAETLGDRSHWRPDHFDDIDSVGTTDHLSLVRTQGGQTRAV